MKTNTKFRLSANDPLKRRISRAAIALLSVLALSCSMSKNTVRNSEVILDPVCNMKIADVSEAYSWKYKDKTYYFDSNTCKETFKMNPEKFITNACNQVK